MPAVELRFGNRSERISLADLGLPANADDARIRSAVARYLDVPTIRLALHTITRRPDGDFTVHPSPAA
jgi:hypothetical protein